VKFSEAYEAEGEAGESYEDFVVRKRKEYLKIANAQRRRLKILRRALRLGAIDDLELLKGNLAEYEPVVASWKIEHLLRACRFVGRARSNWVLEVAHVTPSKLVGLLSYEKRKELSRLVEEVRSGDIHFT